MMAAKHTQRGPPCSSVSGRGERSQYGVSNTYCALPSWCRWMHRFWQAPFARSLNNGSSSGKPWGPCCSPVPPPNPAVRCTSLLKVRSLFRGGGGGRGGSPAILIIDGGTIHRVEGKLETLWGAVVMQGGDVCLIPLLSWVLFLLLYPHACDTVQNSNKTFITVLNYIK